MDDLDRLETWAAPLLAKLSAAERRALARTVARDLRRDNAANMRAQRGPDGAAWEPRKAKLRDQQGRIKKGAKAQVMFAKLRTAKHLKAQATDSEASVGFDGRTERIARVHHAGLRDRVKSAGPEYDYPARPLLGITAKQIKRIEAILVASLSN